MIHPANYRTIKRWWDSEPDLCPFRTLYSMLFCDFEKATDFLGASSSRYKQKEPFHFCYQQKEFGSLSFITKTNPLKYPQSSY